MPIIQLPELIITKICDYLQTDYPTLSVVEELYPHVIRKYLFPMGFNLANMLYQIKDLEKQVDDNEHYVDIVHRLWGWDSVRECLRKCVVCSTIYEENDESYICCEICGEAYCDNCGDGYKYCDGCEYHICNDDSHERNLIECERCKKITCDDCNVTVECPFCSNRIVQTI